jgi:hypothetical protein
VGGALTWKLELAAQDLLLQLWPALGPEGRHPTEHLIQQDPHTPPKQSNKPPRHLWECERL